MSKNFYESVKYSTQESHVQEAYNNAFKSFFNIPVIERKHQCDGYFETKTSDNKEISVLIEYKYDIHMKDRVQRSKVIAQCLGYLKQFEQTGEKLPKLVFIGDINECCVIHTNDLLKLLDLENVDWSVAASSMGDKNVDLVFNIAKDISPWIYDVNNDFKFQDVADKIIDLCSNISRKLHITEKNIEKVYNLFCDRVIKDKKKVQANDLVSTFIGVMLDTEHYYQHPKKKNILIANDKQVAINGDQFGLFMEMHSTEYSPKEKRIMTAISDRLIEDTNRRNKGEFYTPTLFVDYAHKMIEKELGPHWKENYVVWDNCYDSETEFLSDKGWKLFKDYNEDDLVAQYNIDGTINFVKPKRYISQEYTGKWLHLYGSQIDIKCTPDHNFVLIDDHFNRRRGVFKQSAQEVYDRQQRCKQTHLSFIRTFKYNGNIHVDEWIIRLAIAINADGYYNNKLVLNNNTGRTPRNTRFTDNDTSERDVYTISLKKDRKIKRLEWILEQGKFTFTKRAYNDSVNFNIKFPYFDGKHFPKEWYHLDDASKTIFLDEIYNWDGSIQDTKHGIRKSYFTNKKDDCDLVQFIINSMGYGTNMRTDSRKANINYIVHPISHTTAKVSSRNNKFVEESDQNNMCYCFEVDSGMLIVRRNNKIVVSSNCCGTKNLTRDYRFKELYCSTLEQAELDISRNYNKEATSFQFDFLNDSLDDLKVKAPGLLEAFELNKPIVFFLNPPYGKATGAGGKLTAGASDSITKKKMQEEGIEGSELIKQFLWRITNIKRTYNLKNCVLACFTKPSWLIKPQSIKFRKQFLDNFEYRSGVMFNAGEFANVSAQWGITFNIWKTGVTNDRNNFTHALIQSNSGEIEILKNKILYNFDNKDIKTTAKFISENLNRNEKYDRFILCNNDVNSTVFELKKAKVFNDYICCIYNAGNDLQTNNYVTLNVKHPSGGGYLQVTKQNIMQSAVVVAIRQLISANWIIDKDMYNMNVEIPEYFKNDSLIYSIFNYCQSIRQDGHSLNNEFFWISKQEMLDLSEEHNNDYTYEDALNSDERFVYLKLQEIKDDLSPEAKAVLDKATELVKKSFKYREMFNESHPEYQINNWDCGFYQIKALLKEFLPDDLKEFRNIYKQLADKMRPVVYELGFLKK